MCVMQGASYIGPGLDLVSTPRSLGLDTLWSWSWLPTYILYAQLARLLQFIL